VKPSLPKVNVNVKLYVPHAADDELLLPLDDDELELVGGWHRVKLPECHKQPLVAGELDELDELLLEDGAPP
jgi:hypothetical protein